MTADDLDLEPLGRGEAPTLDELEDLDRTERPPRPHPADEQFVADMGAALDLDLRDPAQAREWLATYRRAERRRRASVRRRRGAR